MIYTKENGTSGYDNDKIYFDENDIVTSTSLYENV